eukprot:TRINITY_DN1285_c0_g1_i1.p1 TRINITY_DN1285_c0_g1~~TRINITY_DN1285_c0_g1_i1.p1  ORF type:complete len:505 (+),score=80.78 TRINITY_DN1285_c0_g1_i1:262-1776(+)
MTNRNTILVSVFLILFLFQVNSLSLDYINFTFDKFLDQNENGEVDVSEFSIFACRMEHNKDKCYKQRKINEVFGRFDKDSSGYVTKEEFVEVLASSSKSLLKDPIEGGPQQIHLSVTDKPSEMVVMWITRDKLNSVVQYGTTSKHYNMNATGTISTYSAGIDGWTGWIHTVILENLEPFTKYYYICGNTDNWSTEYSFTTAPTDPSSEAFHSNIFAVAADMGTYIPMGWAVAERMEEDNLSRKFSLALHIGDVCYAGVGDDWELEEIWDVWEDQVQGIAANVPYMFAVGNHEKYYNFTSFNARFLMPGDQCGGEHNFWYSIDYGNVHFTFMSTEHDYSPGSVQYKWIEQDLAKANSNRQQRPWVILSGHRPMYCSDTVEWDDHRAGARFQQLIEPLMIKYKVDLYLCGHMHMYERIYPVINGTSITKSNTYVNPGIPAHVVVGASGVFLDDTFVDPVPEWSAIRTGEYWGYGQMSINSTHLYWSFIDESSGDSKDEFWIIKTSV